MCLQLGQPAGALCPEWMYAWFLIHVLSRCAFATVCYKCLGWLKSDRLPCKHPACITSFSKQPNDQTVRMVGDSWAGVSVFP